MATLEVVELGEGIQVNLDLLDGLVPLFPALDAEVIVEQRAVHALDEAVGTRRTDFSRAMLDVVADQQELVGVLLGPAGELAAVIGKFWGVDLDEG